MKQRARPAEHLCQAQGWPSDAVVFLRTALTHSSWRNEHRDAVSEDNERLEFLGDAVLELSVSEYLFRRDPGATEGELTRIRAAIVCEPTLADFARYIDLPAYLRLGKGEAQSGGHDRPSLLADAVEAVIGGLYLACGIDEVERFLNATFYPFVEEGQLTQRDFKTQLQEQVQRLPDRNLLYETMQETGPAHEREFVVSVRVAGELMGTGTGRSKKEAEQLAARQALSQISSSVLRTGSEDKGDPPCV
ncbi:MAG: ribonuclease III [Firmicutes bacterium]|nr:ribonuclease III [Bacillota bacterium]